MITTSCNELVSGFNTIVPRSVSPSNASVTEPYPTNETTTLPDDACVDKLKLPSKSVDTPLEVPSSMTFAPGSGAFRSEPVTVPVTVLCAIAVTEKINATTNNIT